MIKKNGHKPDPGDSRVIKPYGPYSAYIYTHTHTHREREREWGYVDTRSSSKMSYSA